MKRSSETRGGGPRKRAKPVDDALPDSFSKIKKRIRDTERTLRRDNVTAKQRNELTRKLRAMQLLMIDKQVDELERKMATKYHKVKFFERKKVERKLKQLRLDKGAEDNEQKIHDLEVDLNYIRYYPKTEKYISLFPESPEQEASESLEKKQVIRQYIANAMEKDALEIDNLWSIFREEAKERFKKQASLKDVELEAENAPAKEKPMDDFFLQGDDEEEEEGE
ncbi:hypothetical protein BZG36_03930 [Bifiguratus adelaidae]|uniref:rRNA-processing protein EFG1 n=1 Tax=Bifiguratus adelaidae TaxID=1938954 RepID=A0A261XZ81_9FUNG|nr:hypothetical protein BZG36_03930 [Bifiguratus adelaidae]